jgi:hypothetical protein
LAGALISEQSLPRIPALDTCILTPVLILVV